MSDIHSSSWQTSPSFDVTSFVSAELGNFFIELEAIPHSDTPLIHYRPVLAWAIVGEQHKPLPVTLNGIQTEDIAILNPGGTVSCPGESEFSSVNDWLALELHPLRYSKWKMGRR